MQMTMNCAAKVVGTWINPNVCPHIAKSCRNLKGWFQSMSWEMIAVANKLEIFKVRNSCDDLDFSCMYNSPFLPALLSSKIFKGCCYT